MQASEVIRQVLPAVQEGPTKEPIKPEWAAERTFVNFLTFLKSPAVSGRYVADLAVRTNLLIDGDYRRYPNISFDKSTPPEISVKSLGYITLSVADIPTMDFKHNSVQPRICLPRDLWTQTREEPLGQMLETVKVIYLANLFADGRFSSRALDKSEEAERVNDLLLDMVKIWDISDNALRQHPLGQHLLGIRERYPDGTSFTPPNSLRPLPFLGPSAVACITSLPYYFKDNNMSAEYFKNTKENVSDSAKFKDKISKMSQQKHLLN